MQIKLTEEPFAAPTEYGAAPEELAQVQWITDPAWDGASPRVAAFRRRFTLPTARALVFHLSADQRYTLYVDGERQGFGPDRGTRENWFYQTYRLELAAGEHTLVACVSWLPPQSELSHAGHVAVALGLLVFAEGDDEKLVGTGAAAWEVLPLPGIVQERKILSNCYYCVGAHTSWHADDATRLYRSGADAAGAWATALAKGRGMFKAVFQDVSQESRSLRHSLLPAMYEAEVVLGQPKYGKTLAKFDGMAAESVNPIRLAESEPELCARMGEVLSGKGAVFPARSVSKFIIDAGDYYCAWPVLKVSGGKGAHISIGWAESLFTDKFPQGWGLPPKANRDGIDGRYFYGVCDDFYPDGRENAEMEPLWWQAGRYLCVVVAAGEEPLAFHSLKLRETHFPYKFAGEFRTDDRRWDGIFAIGRRALEMCSHETYFDCPYYEQMMYGGDTRLEMLTAYLNTADSSLQRKAMLLFDESRTPGGLTKSRIPDNSSQTIPGFSLWWVMMVYDYALWRDDKPFVRERMLGVHAVLDSFLNRIGEDGLMRAHFGWNFTDWVQGWGGGIPEDAHRGVNATANIQLVLALRATARLEKYLGAPLLAAHYTDAADKLAAKIREHLYVPEKHLFRESLLGRHFTEHAQCLAVLAEILPPEETARLATAMLKEPGIDRTTIYFSHYLFEAFAKLERLNEVYDRFGLWFTLRDNGLKTTIESPEPTRSDCHAWGAHPLYHALASIVGLRPTEFGFRGLEIRPQLCGLREIAAAVPCPQGGTVKIRIRATGDKPEVTVDSPVPVRA